RGRAGGWRAAHLRPDRDAGGDRDPPDEPAADGDPGLRPAGARLHLAGPCHLLLLAPPGQLLHHLAGLRDLPAGARAGTAQACGSRPLKTWKRYQSEGASSAIPTPVTTSIACSACEGAAEPATVRSGGTR